MPVAVFEDRAAESFLPLTYTKAVFDLRVGLYTLLERVERLFGKVEYAFVRPHLEEFYALDRGLGYPEDPDDELLLVNPRYVLDEKAMEKLSELSQSGRWFLLVHGSDAVGAKLPAEMACEVSRTGFDAGLALRGFNGKLSILHLEKARSLSQPWELIEANAEALARDLKGLEGIEGDVDETVKVIGKRGLRVEEGAVVEPYVVVDTRGGGILVEKGAVVKSFAYVEGPACIGRDTVVMPGARIRGGCSIGPVCRVGGEVEESIIHGYSNKYHDGFLGHAYVGEWVNLGALTTNSDLKNTYGTVRFGPRRLDTGRQKVGVFIADMVKTSVGTFLYTGKSVGVASHLHGTVAEDVPSFTIYARSLGVEPVELDLESALKTLERMMGRRGLTPTNAMRRLLERVFHITERERLRAGVKRGRFSLQLLGTAP
jgi:UDP-N-acetylglucosamine diphosphorylase/glucosamine-1-phosphate N-acetyltransferase